ncbi:MAG: nucleoside 2-deoxyribosyltransferase [Halovenus sp.]
MELYFCGSIRGGRADAGLYERLIGILRTHGTVLTEHVGTDDVETTESQGDTAIHDQDVAWLRQADVVVAEVTTPSLGVGYEVGKAREWEKPVLCLYRPDGDHELSAMIRGSDVRVVEYSDPETLEPVFRQFVDEHREYG